MRTLSLILLMILSLQAQGQYLSHLQDGDSTTDFGNYISLKQDGNLFMLGNGGKADGRYLLFSMITNSDGSQKLDEHFINSDTFSYSYEWLGTLRNLNNNGYLIGVTRQGPSAQNGFTSEAMIAKYDAQGNIMFLKQYGDTNVFWQWAWDCTVMPDGGYLLGGEHGDFAQSHKPAVLWRTDSAGNELWSREYEKEPGHRTAVNSLEVLDNDRILVGMTSSTVVVLNNNQYSLNRPWFTIMDTAGNILKDTFYTSNVYGGGGAIFKDINGGFFHYGDIDTLVNNDVNYWGNFPWFLTHLDSNFSMQWITVFSGSETFDKNLWAIKQLHDSGYVVVGNLYPLSGHTRGWAAKVDKYGNIVWDNTYQDYPQNDCYLVDVIEMPDHNLMMVGSAKDNSLPSWRQYDAWILGVDSNGCEITGCTPSPTAVKQLPNSSVQLYVYPNPTSGIFTIESYEVATIQLCDLQGRKIQEYETAKGKTQLEFPGNLTAGVYIARVYYRNGGQAVARLVYQP